MKQREWQVVAGSAKSSLPVPSEWAVGKFMLTRVSVRWVLQGLMLESVTKGQRLLPLTSPLFAPEAKDGLVLTGHRPIRLDDSGEEETIALAISKLPTEEASLRAYVDYALSGGNRLNAVEYGAYACAILGNMHSYREIIFRPDLVASDPAATDIENQTLERRRSRVALAREHASRDQVLAQLARYRSANLGGLKARFGLKEVRVET